MITRIEQIKGMLTQIDLMKKTLEKVVKDKSIDTDVKAPKIKRMRDTIREVQAVALRLIEEELNHNNGPRRQ